MSKIQNSKAIHNKDRVRPFSDAGVVAMSKIQNSKAIHNIPV